MRGAIRNLAVWALTLALLSSAWLPMTARFEAVDADGVCGPVLVFPHTVEHFEANAAQPASGHCLVCHLRHDMAGAFVSSVVQVVLPDGGLPSLVGRPTRRPTVVVIGQAPPRGPPATS